MADTKQQLSHLIMVNTGSTPQGYQLKESRSTNAKHVRQLDYTQVQVEKY